MLDNYVKNRHLSAIFSLRSGNVSNGENSRDSRIFTPEKKKAAGPAPAACTLFFTLS